MMIKKTLTILAASCMMYSCTTKTESNPFFTEFQTEYGVPSFDKIKLEHYEPAFLKGIEEQNQNIEAIILEPGTFQTDKRCLSTKRLIEPDNRTTTTARQDL